MLFQIFFAFLASAPAWAQDAAPVSSSMPKPDPMQGLLMNLPLILGIVALFWFGVIRPQKKQQQEQEKFVSSLKRGDEVVTNAGIVGTIVGLTERIITIQIDEGTEMRVLRSQINSLFKNNTSTQQG